MTLLNPYFGKFGGMYVPQILMPALLELEKNFVEAQKDINFHKTFFNLLKNYLFIFCKTFVINYQLKNIF